MQGTWWQLKEAKALHLDFPVKICCFYTITCKGYVHANKILIIPVFGTCSFRDQNVSLSFIKEQASVLRSRRAVCIQGTNPSVCSTQLYINEGLGLLGYWPDSKFSRWFSILNLVCVYGWHISAILSDTGLRPKFMQFEIAKQGTGYPFYNWETTWKRKGNCSLAMCR